MKKIYSKPQIVFDSFELSQSIAAGCEFISNQAWQVCPVDINIGRTIFTAAPCQFTTPGDDDLVCYHNPADNKNVFSS